MKQPLTGQHIGERGPALEGAKYRAFGGVIHRILFNFGTVCRIPRIVLLDVAVKHAGEYPLIGWQQPALQRTGVGMRPQSFGCGARRAAADAIRVNDADIRIKPSLAVVLYLP